MIDPELLKIMCCPETHQPIALAESSLIQDRKFLYPIRGDIPIMLIDEAIPL